MAFLCRVTGDLAEENSKQSMLDKDAEKIKEISSRVSSRTASYSVFLQDVKGAKGKQFAFLQKCTRISAHPVPLKHFF